LLGPAALLGLVFNYKFNLTEILWSFSIWLEAIAILPQLFMLQRTGEAETITTHYLAALGIYRALYIPNWIYRWVVVSDIITPCPVPSSSSFDRKSLPHRYFAEGVVDPIAITAGIVQTGLYLDFFYIYFTKCVSSITPFSEADTRS